MFYRPTNKATGEMWDTWLYWHDGTCYLYYLAKSNDQWDNISMAVSDDGVHWTESGPILHKGPEVTWMGTGSTWKSPLSFNAGKFQMNFSEWIGPRQTIFFAVSDDLINWKRLDAEYEFVQDERWYECLGRWDCIWTIPKPKGGFYGYWTATPKSETGGCFGFGQSLDGVKWEALPPPTVHAATEGEVGAIEIIDGRYYMMFGKYPQMMTLVADKPEGPFHFAQKNCMLLGGHTYFSRFFPTPAGLLVNHHSIARDGHIYMGLLKKAVADNEGVLRLAWWENNDIIKQEKLKLEIPFIANPAQSVQIIPESFNVAQGVIVECQMHLPPTHFAARRGLYIESAEGSGMTVLFDAQGRAEFCQTDQYGSNCIVERRVDREMNFAGSTHLRLVLAHSLMELYLDDILIDCFSLSACATGKIGLIQGGEPDAFSEIIAWC